MDVVGIFSRRSRIRFGHLGARGCPLTKRTRVAVAVLVVLLATCSRDQSTGPDYTIIDGAHHSGNRNFFFLPPLVPDPSADPDFDANGFDGTQPAVVVICAVGTDDCDPTQPAGFPITFATADVAVDETAQQYAVSWHAGDYALDPARTYRIQVLVSGARLGFADVDVVASGTELRNVNTNEYIPLLNGRTLRIKFRIERGAIAYVRVSEPITLNDGTIVLPPVDVVVREAITVADETRLLPPAIVNIRETVAVTDQVRVLPPVLVNVSEQVTVTDQQRILPPAIVAVLEPITVRDQHRVLPPVSVNIAEFVAIADQIRVLPPAAVTVAEGLRVTDRIGVLPPVSIAIHETIAVTDDVAVTTP